MPSLEIVQRLLLDGPLRQRDFVAVLSLSAVAVSRALNGLERLGIVRTDGKRAPYEVVYPDKTEELLQAAADLARFILADKLDAVDDRAKALRKGRMARSTLSTVRDGVT